MTNTKEKELNDELVGYKVCECEGCEGCNCYEEDEEEYTPIKYNKFFKLNDVSVKYFENVSSKTGNKTVTAIYSCEVEKRNLNGRSGTERVIEDVISELAQITNGWDWYRITTKHTVTCAENDTFDLEYGKKLALNGAKTKALSKLTATLLNTLNNIATCHDTVASELFRYCGAEEKQRDIYQKLVEEGPIKN